MSCPPNSQDAAATSSPPPRTRSGRVSKPPVRYEPIEQVEDDYSDAEYDSHESDTCEDDPTDEESDVDDESDADEDGNLDGFVVADKSESDEESSEDDGEPAVPETKRPRAPVKKRPTVRK